MLQARTTRDPGAAYTEAAALRQAIAGADVVHKYLNNQRHFAARIDPQELTCKPPLALDCPADIHRAIADRTRRAILDELVDRSGQTLFELCGRLTMKHGISSSRQAISQHLEVLEAAGLIRTRREGRSIRKTAGISWGPP